MLMPAGYENTSALQGGCGLEVMERITNEPGGTGIPLKPVQKIDGRMNLGRTGGSGNALNAQKMPGKRRKACGLFKQSIMTRC